MYRLKQNQHWYCKYYGSYDAVFINPLARNYYLCPFSIFRLWKASIRRGHVRETGLLQMLCEKRGDVIRREAILDKFWNTEDDYFASRSLDVFVTRLRKFLSEDESVTIKTVKGVGLILIEN